jgi:hypothetical protein
MMARRKATGKSMRMTSARFAPEEADTALLRPEDLDAKTVRQERHWTMYGLRVCTSAADDIIIGHGSAYVLAATLATIVHPAGCP